MKNPVQVKKLLYRGIRIATGAKVVLSLAVATAFTMAPLSQATAATANPARKVVTFYISHSNANQLYPAAKGRAHHDSEECAN